MGRANARMTRLESENDHGPYAHERKRKPRKRRPRGRSPRQQQVRKNRTETHDQAIRRVIDAIAGRTRHRIVWGDVETVVTFLCDNIYNDDHALGRKRANMERVIHWALGTMIHKELIVPVRVRGNSGYELNVVLSSGQLRAA